MIPFVAHIAFRMRMLFRQRTKKSSKKKKSSFHLQEVVDSVSPLVRIAVQRTVMVKTMIRQLNQYLRVYDVCTTRV